jgi:hypothetical protein
VADAAGIGIPASGLLFQYRSILVPDWGSPFSGTELVPASVFFVHFGIRIPNNPAFRYLKKEIQTSCMSTLQT